MGQRTVKRPINPQRSYTGKQNNDEEQNFERFFHPEIKMAKNM
jgi:hypothetical protein